jgi:hypothetical protein
MKYQAISTRSDPDVEKVTEMVRNDLDSLFGRQKCTEHEESCAKMVPRISVVNEEKKVTDDQTWVFQCD